MKKKEPFIDPAQNTGEAGVEGEGGEGSEKKTYNVWHKQFYQAFFDVDTTEVLYRMLLTITPWRLRFMAAVAKNPDLYGPFWITATVSFVVAASSNMHDYYISHGTNWAYNTTKMVAAPSVLYGYVLVIPLVLWLVLRCIEAPLRFAELACLYGYSLILFFPASVVCIFVNEVFKWIAIIAAASVSGWFIISNMFMPLKEKYFKRGLVIVLVLAALHLGLTLTMLFYFFSNKQM